MRLIYGTGNPAKLSAMKKRLNRSFPVIRGYTLIRYQMKSSLEYM